MQKDGSDRVGAIEQKTADHLRRAIETARLVIDQNRQLAADFPDHRASAEQRVIDGEAELATLEEELANFEAQQSAPKGARTEPGARPE